MNLSNRFFDLLNQSGVDYCASVSGGGIMYLVDAASENKSIKTEYFHHEQSAGIAAEAYSRATSRISSCLVTIGPGVANGVSAAFSAFLNSVPVIFISGAKRSNVKADYKNVRFTFPQDVDTEALVSGVVKSFWEINTADQLTETVRKACRSAVSGRPGPVWISIPLDIQSMEASAAFDEIQAIESSKVNISNELNQFLERNKRTIVVTGSGADRVAENLGYKKFLENLGLPCITSISSNHTIPFNTDQNLGVFGPVGRRSANHLLMDSDSLIVLGSGLDVDITGFDRKSFFAGKEILIVNPDLNLYIQESPRATYIREKLESLAFNELNPAVSHQKSWISYSKFLKDTLSLDYEEKFNLPKKSDQVDPYLFARKLKALQKVKTGFALGISLDVVCVSHSIELFNGSQLFASKHCGQLGWDIPAAIGLAHSGQFDRVVCITGDGSIMFNLQDLATLARADVPVAIFIFNNAGYDSIRSSQRAHLGGRIHGSDLCDLKFPNWRDLAKSFDYGYRQITSNSELDVVIDEVGSLNKVIVNVILDPNQGRSPKILSKIKDGKFYSPKLSEQYPELPSEVLEKIATQKKKVGL